MQQVAGDKYIWLIEPDEANIGDLQGYLAGWYFADEIEGLNGPYSTRQEAVDAMTEYGKTL